MIDRRLLAMCCLLYSPVVTAQTQASRFVHLSDIMLPEDPLIATVDQLLQLDNGDLYVVDRTSQAVHRFTEEGVFLYTLSIARCDPGRQFSPYWVSSDGNRTFVVNGGPWGYLFDAAGTCQGQVSDAYYPLGLQVSTHDGLVGLHRTADPNTPLHITVSTSDGAPRASFALTIGDFPVANRRMGPGGLAASESAIYYAPPIDPVIHRVDVEGAISTLAVDSFLSNRLPDHDLPPGIPGPEFFRQIGAVRFATTNQGLFSMGDGLLVAQYLTPPEKWERLWLSALDGSVLWSETDTTGYAYMRGGLAYRVVQPAARDHGETPNPYLKLYDVELPASPTGNE